MTCAMFVSINVRFDTFFFLSNYVEDAISVKCSIIF